MSAHLPQLSAYQTGREMITAFRGLNHTGMTGLDELRDMRNLSSDGYPALTPRRQRGLCALLKKPNGLFARDALGWVDGTNFFYAGGLRGQVADGPKQFVAMGAYILIWPDKVCYNTQDGSLTSLDARYTSESNVTFTLCRADGSAYDDYATGITAPDDPQDGQLWVDTSQTPHVLKQFSAMQGMWVSMPTTYVKIAAAGIGADFAKHDGVTISGCDDEALNGDMILQGAEADAVIITGILDTAYTQQNPVTIAREAPQMDYVTEYGNRVWGCSSAKHEIYASKLGDPKNWRCYMGVSTDSYAATIGTAGDFTGACAHMGTVLFFKEHVIHKVFGYKPSNFEITDTTARGVEAGSSGSLVTVNETLYYKARSGICAYGMAMPQGIGAALGGGAMDGAVAGQIGEKYYVSMRTAQTPAKEGAAEDGNWALYVFDAARGMWHREDDTHALAFATVGGVLYCLRADGAMLEMNGVGEHGIEAEERVDWMAESGDIGLASPDKKYVTKLQLRLEVSRDALVRIWVRYEYGGEYREIYRINPGRQRSVTVPIIPRRCDTMRLRLDGYGQVAVHSLCRTMEEGSYR